MQRISRSVLYLAAASLCLGSRAHGTDDIITWVRRCGGTVSTPYQRVHSLSHKAASRPT